MTLRSDVTFRATAKLAMEAPVETLAFTRILGPDGTRPHGLAVVDVDPTSKSWGQIVRPLTMPDTGDAFHPFGWNACSPALSPLTAHAFPERCFLVIPGVRPSRISVIDVKAPLDAKIQRIIGPDVIFARMGHSCPSKFHCGPEGINVSTLGGGGPDGTDGPPGIVSMDRETF